MDLSAIIKLSWGDLPDDLSELGPKLQPVIREQRRQFLEKFGREPGLTDPIMFDPDAEVPRFHSVTNVRAEMVALMKRAGIPPVLIFAYEKPG